MFISQNFFGLPMETPRMDAGRGLWLQGDGAGGFTTTSGAETGVKVYGEQRAAAVADVDGDGRVDLAVTQNGAATNLYRNTQAAPGFRVRLAGPPGNPAGIGAMVRIRYDDGSMGPGRLISAGSGYWSQASWAPVLGRDPARTATHVVVHWPSGGMTERAVSEESTPMTIRHDE